MNGSGENIAIVKIQIRIHIFLNLLWTLVLLWIEKQQSCMKEIILILVDMNCFFKIVTLLELNKM